MRNSRGFLKVLLIVGIVLCPVAAWANMPPDPLAYGAVSLILPVLAGCMALGGALAILAVRRPVRTYRRVLAIGGLALLILLGFLDRSISFLMLLVCLLIVIRYSAAMIVWGIEARRPPEKRRPFLRDAEPNRLFAAGVLAILTTAIFTHMFISYYGRYPTASKYKNLGEIADFLNYQSNYSRQSVLEIGRPVYAKPSPEFGSKEWFFEDEVADRARDLTGLSDHAVPKRYISSEAFSSEIHFPSSIIICLNAGIEFWLAPDRRSFKIWVWPNTFPDWPYNYIFPLTSYFADQTGQIRMIKVHRPEKCPEDAPVIETIKP